MYNQLASLSTFSLGRVSIFILRAKLLLSRARLILALIWTDAHAGEYAPRFSQEVAVEKGVLTFAE